MPMREDAVVESAGVVDVKLRRLGPEALERDAGADEACAVRSDAAEPRALAVRSELNAPLEVFSTSITDARFRRG